MIYIGFFLIGMVAGAALVVSLTACVLASDT